MSPQPSHALVALDGSPLADEALLHALTVLDCRVTVLNVVTPLDAGMSEGGVLEADGSRQAAERERANQLVERASEQAAAENRVPLPPARPRGAETVAGDGAPESRGREQLWTGHTDCSPGSYRNLYTIRLLIPP